VTSKPGPEELRLRPHHIMCEPFMVLETFDRGEAFNALANHIREALESQADTLIQVIEGVDDLCQTCPLCQDGRCQSPDGDETAVRKWDAIVLRGMEISYGDRLTAGHLSALIKQKTPLPLCLTKCRWKNDCHVLSSR
jgi:hypothetical protein